MDSMTKEHTIHFDKEAWHKLLGEMSGLSKVDQITLGNSTIEFLEPIYIRKHESLTEIIGTDTKTYTISFLNDVEDIDNYGFITRELQPNIKSIKEILK